MNKLIVKKDRVTREVDKETSGQVNKLIVEEDRVTRKVDKGTSGRVNELIVNELIAKEDKVTGEQGVSTCNIWGGEGTEKSKKLIHFLQEEFSFYLLSLLTLQVITL